VLAVRDRSEVGFATGRLLLLSEEDEEAEDEEAKERLAVGRTAIAAAAAALERRGAAVRARVGVAMVMLIDGRECAA
jgi:hypothetical protein